MQVVPREAFLPPELAEFAYEDTPLPIEEDQTISQPYIGALMISAIEPGERDRVLEIGTGSGYAAAVLSRVVGQVYTIERHAPLADLARRRLRNLGYANVEIRHGDGSLGWPEHAPYDGIIVTAGGPHVPRHLRDQLAVGGRPVIPIGRDPRLQELVPGDARQPRAVRRGAARTGPLRSARRGGCVGGPRRGAGEGTSATRHPAGDDRGADS
jgi:protein-L-isoaspartate(D-aspartate) O-methyltransferase